MFFVLIFCKSQDTKAWRPLQGVGYNFFLQRPLPLTPRAETVLPLLHSIQMYAWVSPVRSLAGRAESTTSPILCSKCHDRDSNLHSAGQTPELESNGLNTSYVFEPKLWFPFSARLCNLHRCDRSSVCIFGLIMPRIKSPLVGFAQTYIKWLIFVPNYQCIIMPTFK